MERLGRAMVWLGALGLAVGILPLLVVAVVDPSSTAVGPGLLMVVTVPPSLLLVAVGGRVRAFGRRRAARRAAEAAAGARDGAFWRGAAADGTGQGERAA